MICRIYGIILHIVNLVYIIEREMKLRNYSPKTIKAYVFRYDFDKKRR